MNCVLKSLEKRWHLACFWTLIVFFVCDCSQGDMKSNEIASEEPGNEAKVTNVQNPSSVDVDTQVVDQLPRVETFSKSNSIASS